MGGVGLWHGGGNTPMYPPPPPTPPSLDETLLMNGWAAVILYMYVDSGLEHKPNLMDWNTDL